MKKLLLLAGMFAFLASCENTNNNNNSDSHDGHAHDSAQTTYTNQTEEQPEIIAEKGGIRIAYFDKSPDFPNAKLTAMKPSDGENIAAGKYTFQYKVENFELTKQTEDAEHKHANNSHQGQHIHHILNNEPYTAHYSDTFSKTLKPGHYVNLAFLSRSYHESIKHKTAYQLNQFTVGKTSAKSEFDPKSQHMFYSRPKGDYVGKDTMKVLLDFYLVNTDLSENGNKVRATINGNEFILNRWVPYAIYGLPMGENTIKLELLDKDNKIIPGPFNTVTRKINLKAQ